MPELLVAIAAREIAGMMDLRPQEAREIEQLISVEEAEDERWLMFRYDGGTIEGSPLAEAPECARADVEEFAANVVAELEEQRDRFGYAPP